jgi:hypothetical protein
MGGRREGGREGRRRMENKGRNEMKEESGTLIGNTFFFALLLALHLPFLLPPPSSSPFAISPQKFGEKRRRGEEGRLSPMTDRVPATISPSAVLCQNILGGEMRKMGGGEEEEMEIAYLPFWSCGDRFFALPPIPSFIPNRSSSSIHPISHPPPPPSFFASAMASSPSEIAFERRRISAGRQ